MFFHEGVSFDVKRWFVTRKCDLKAAHHKDDTLLKKLANIVKSLEDIQGSPC